MIQKTKTHLHFHFLIVILVASVTGCARNGVLGVDCHADIAKGSVPEPIGTKICQWQDAHIQKAASDHTTLYRSDFVGTTNQLSPGAIEKISSAFRKGTAYSQSWIVEPSNDAGLDSARINVLSQKLSQWGLQNPQVQIGLPTALGMPGIFAESSIGNFGARSQNRNQNRSSAATGFFGRTN